MIVFMIIGIESTAHTFGVGVVDNGKILANVKDSYTTEKGGLIPIEVARHHREVCDRVFEDAVAEAGISKDEIEGVAFSQGPGLAPCLKEGLEFAKRLAKELNVSLIGVNHCVAHLEIGGAIRCKDPVMLYVSGANTQVIAYAGGKYRVFGETLDNGIGNFIDGFARYLGLGFPGGPKIAELAEKSDNYIELPYAVKGMDVSFSGMQTKLKQLYDRGERKEDLAFSLQETAFAMLVEAAERAMAHTGKEELLLGGGVGCNTRLQEMCRIMCEERGAKFFVPSNSLLVDNGGMIAYLGEIMFEAGLGVSLDKIDKVDFLPRQRTDDVSVEWK
tara:strand:+ start:11615 stop:12607 length:993 start_codon:yes stop_codon:yes gene_type:complete